MASGLPWPMRSVIAGTAGTAALTVAYRLEHRVRPADRGPLDYDDSLVPGQIVATILHLPSVTGREEQELGRMLRWSYGSAFGLWHGLLGRRWREPQATGLFAGTLITATMTLFPLLGHTPPPWRWPRGYLVTSLSTHVVYAVVVATVDDRLRRRR
jgi:hypothetical protein